MKAGIVLPLTPAPAVRNLAAGTFCPGGFCCAVIAVAQGRPPAGVGRGRRSILLTLLAAALVLGCSEPRRSTDKTILIDNLHSRKRTQDIGMTWDAYDYSSLNGTKTLFDFLAGNGYRHRFLTPADAPRLTPEILAQTRILFVDLIGDPQNCVDFDAREIEVVRQWVRHGGSLIVVVDHTNVYQNARRTNPLLAPFGVQAHFASAMDKVPENAMQGGVWVKVRAFVDHPATRGVSTVVFITGTVLDTRHGAAFLSEHGFADAWLPERSDPSWMGNFRYDPGEPRGALPLIAAGDYGRGRFVVLGDENLLGNSRLFMAHNFELVANVFEWLAQEEGATPPLRERLTADLRVGFDLFTGDWNVAGNGCNCYLNFYVDFNRIPGVVARATPSLDGSWHVVVLADPMVALNARDLAYVHRHLADGGTVLLLTDVARARAGTPHLLQELLPDLVLSGKREFSAAALPAGPELLDKIAGRDEFPLESTYLDVRGMRMAAHEYAPDKRCGFDVDHSQPYLLQLTASGGVPFLQARAGDCVVDLARLYSINGGRLIVFFQDSFFRAETMGVERFVPSGPRTADAHRVTRVLVEWLMKQHGAVPQREGPPSAANP